MFNLTFHLYKFQINLKGEQVQVQGGLDHGQHLIPGQARETADSGVRAFQQDEQGARQLQQDDDDHHRRSF